MATVEIPSRVCHKCGTKVAGPTATIGNSCYSNPLWNATGCIGWDMDLVGCNSQSLTLSSPQVTALPLSLVSPQSLPLAPTQPVDLPLSPEREEAPGVV